MLHTLFIINSQGEILMEKHWRAKVPREAGEEFWLEASKADKFSDVAPVIATAKYYFVHLYRSCLFFLAVQQGEGSPSMTIQLLDQITEIFSTYFGGLSESKIKENFVHCYELLDEMIDYGFPVLTEPTVLKELVSPPSLLNKIQRFDPNRATHLSSTAKSLAESPVPWRKTGIRYSNNEIFFDIKEEMDFIIDCNGTMVAADIHGRIECQSRLSGMPDMLAMFANQQRLTDASFHPCVRFARYEQDRSLSFVPPDGTFEIMRYRVLPTGGQCTPAPFYVTPTVTLQEDHGRINIIAGIRGGGAALPEKGITDFKVLIELPDNTDSVKMDTATGTSSFDAETKIFKWNIGKLSRQKAPTINGTVIPRMGTKFPKGGTPSVQVQFKLAGWTASELKIESVSLVNDSKARFWKGMKSSTVNGRYEIRTS